MAYEGMSHLKLFKNFACTDEIESNVEGTFVYTSEPVSNNAMKPNTVTLFVKNVGTHKAYDLTIKVITTDIPILGTVDKSIVLSKQVVRLILSGDFEKGIKGNKAVITLEYNNV